MKIFIAAGETSLGPYTVEEIREAINDGSIQADGLGCIEGESAWHPISALLNPRPAEAIPATSTRPPEPSMSVANANGKNIKPCPHCAGTVAVTATKCPHCGGGLRTPEAKLAFVIIALFIIAVICGFTPNTYVNAALDYLKEITFWLR